LLGVALLDQVHAQYPRQFVDSEETFASRVYRSFHELNLSQLTCERTLAHV